MLDIVVSYYWMQFQRKIMIQTKENGKKPHFGPDLGPSGPTEKANDPILRKFSERRTDGGQRDKQTDGQE